MDAWILAAEAFAAYGLVLWTHSLRQRFGLAIFYALLGCLTAISCWETDAGVIVRLGDITFLVGSTVFYTSLLLGVFVVYVFDGPRATQVAILTVIGGQILVAFFSLMLHLQFRLSATPPLAMMPIPSLRANLASVLTNLADLVFLVVCWEYMHGKWRGVPLALKAFLTLLGVMLLDVLLFNTGAFLGEPGYISMMSGTVLSRLVVACVTAPFLWAYLRWQNLANVLSPHRPLAATLQELSDLRMELQIAQQEIERRRQAETSLARSENRYRQLIDNASEPIAVIQNGKYLLHNAKLLELTGLRPKALQRANFSDFIHPDDRQKVFAIMTLCLRGACKTQGVEFRATTAAGTPLTVQANMVGIDWDGHGASLAFLHDVTEQRRKELQLKTKVIQDELTGVFNRRGFTDALNDFAAGAARDRVYAALYIDVDKFKAINDEYGHATGDQVLRTVAQAVRSLIRESDFVGRMGGDEFAVLLDGADDAEAQAISRRILDLIATACKASSGGKVAVSASIGFAQYTPGNPRTASELLDAADQAMLQAKRQGGNQALPAIAPG